MDTRVPETERPAPRVRPKRGCWLVAILVLCLVAIWLAAIASTHAALSGGFVGWSAPSAGLTSPTATELTQAGLNSDDDQMDYGQVLWATRPGGEVAFGFELHNGGLAPVTVLGVALRTIPPGDITALAPAGAQLGPGFDQMVPFHPVTLGPGGSARVGLTERVVCDPLVQKDARLGHDSSVLGDATSPVVLRYRVLGVTMSQTVSVATPILVLLPYQACT